MHHRWIQIQGRVVVTKPADWNRRFHSRGPGTGLDHQEEDAVLWKPEAGCPYPHYPHTWGTSWEVAGAVCSTASLRKTREMQAQSSHIVSARATSFLGIANYSIHRKLSSFPFDQSIGLRGLGRSPNATSGQCQAEIT